MVKIEIEIQGKNFLFGEAANYDFIQDALIFEKMSQGKDYTEDDVDPMIWVAEKMKIFKFNDDGKLQGWAYKGGRDLGVISIYSGVNNHSRANKQPKISVEDASNFLYDLGYEERAKIIAAFVNSLVTKVDQNGQGEPEAQQGTAVS